MVVTGDDLVVGLAVLELLLEHVKVGLHEDELHVRGGAVRVGRGKTGLRRVLGVRGEDDGVDEEDLDGSLGAGHGEHLVVEVGGHVPASVAVLGSVGVLDLGKDRVAAVVVVVAQNQVPGQLGGGRVVDVLVVSLPEGILDTGDSALVEVVAEHDEEARAQLSGLGGDGVGNLDLLEGNARLRHIGRDVVAPVSVEEEGELVLARLSRGGSEAGSGEHEEHGERLASHGVQLTTRCCCSYLWL